MRIEPQTTESVPAVEVTQSLQRLGWMAPDEADAMRQQLHKLERACGGAVVMIDGLRQAVEMARQCIDADDVIGAHQILVRALGEKE